MYLEEIGSSDETGDVSGADLELFGAAHVEQNQFECFSTDLLDIWVRFGALCLHSPELCSLFL